MIRRTPSGTVFGRNSAAQAGFEHGVRAGQRVEKTNASQQMGPSKAPEQAPKSRLRRFLSHVNKSVGAAALKGVLIATLVGSGLAATPAVYAQQVPSPSAPAAVVQVRAAQQQQDIRHTAKDSAALKESLEATRPFKLHMWRDAAPINADGTINGYIEIERGDRTKWEYVIDKNAREVDRMLHDSLDGYPVNYGFLPGSLGFDGDPFDVLVLGPKIDGGKLVNGKIVGIMHMDDEKGPDPKVVISPVDDQGNALYELTAAEKARIGAWFDAYKKPDAHKGKWAKVTGWGDAADADKYVKRTTDFFDAGIKADPTVRPAIEKLDARPIRILVTGFAPFENRSLNMSSEVVKTLEALPRAFAGVTLKAMMLPVEYEAAAQSVIAATETFEPDLVVSLGEDLGLKKLELEALARNNISGGADNAGVLRRGTIIPGGPRELRNDFDLLTLAARIDDATDAIDVKLDSKSGPGGFVCNDLYYRVMTDLKAKGIPMIYAHVPTLNDRSLTDVADGVRALVQSGADMVREAQDQSEAVNQG